jgi:hypothetical protein
LIKGTQPAVLILAFLRHNGVKRLIESCLENEVSRIYISIDGPRSDSDRSIQDEMLEIIREFQVATSVQLFVQRHEQNLGVGVGVISGLDWFFSHEDSGHILEDDLIVDSNYFTFSRIALLEFANHESVKMVSGSQLIPTPSSGNEVPWSNYPMIWGWSSWSDKWKVMRDGLLQRKSFVCFRKDSTLNNFWAVGANRVLDGKVDTWDTPLAAEFYRRKWICIIPPSNLVTNSGDDLQAFHTKGDTFGLNLSINKLSTNLDFYSLSSPECINGYNKQLEKIVFKVKKRHLFSPLYAPFSKRNQLKLKMAPLADRLVES